MIQYFRTDDRKIHEEDGVKDGVWVNMVNPSEGEGRLLAEKLDVDIHDLLAALDEEETSRIELEDGYTLILVDIPSTEIRFDKVAYTTIPLGIVLTQNTIVTVCNEDTPVLQAFMNGRVKEFSTKKRLRFVYQILFRVATQYQTVLRTSGWNSILRTRSFWAMSLWRTSRRSKWPPSTVISRTAPEN